MIVGKEDEMRSMTGRVEEYLDKKRLELNTKKPKIIRFKKRSLEKVQEELKMEK